MLSKLFKLPSTLRVPLPLPFARGATSLYNLPALTVLLVRPHSTPGMALVEQEQQEQFTPPTEISGDFSIIGTDSAEYHCVDTDPSSTTEPYEFPRHSGPQLRYGGKEIMAKPTYPDLWLTPREINQKQSIRAD